MVTHTARDNFHLIANESDSTDYLALQISDSTINTFFNQDLADWLPNAHTMQEVKNRVADFIDQYTVI